MLECVHIILSVCRKLETFSRRRTQALDIRDVGNK